MSAAAADALIDRLGLRPHPEGGCYVETYRDHPADGSGRGAVSCIYFLLRAGERSAWHRIDATEIWHYQAGGPLAITLSSNGRGAETYRLGPDVLKGERPHVVVPPFCWQTAGTLGGGGWTLVSCTVAPAFTFEGFELAPAGWCPTPG
ncbi:MAG TPA: cupin domain-containing protein [Thermoanaerobaculia bacterium]|nr:cupin domain-containing protein [Thermoanaerobaculia bacterium]